MEGDHNDHNDDDDNDDDDEDDNDDEKTKHNGSLSIVYSILQRNENETFQVH